VSAQILFATQARKVPVTGGILKAWLLIFLLPAALSAPSVKGTLRGRVIDGKDAPVAKAIIAVISTQGRVKLAASNAQGEYAICGLDPGQYTIWAARGNFHLFDKAHLEISHGEVEIINISLADPPGQHPRLLPAPGRIPMELAALVSIARRAADMGAREFCRRRAGRRPIRIS
jgi:hypothetical protein